MASASRRVLVWSPRILGILVAVFFMIFSLGVFYAVITTRHPDWILAISGPLFVVGMLFFLSWRRGGKAERTSEP